MSSEIEQPDIESSSDDYATRFHGAVGQWFLDMQEQGTFHALKGLPGKRILDVGGGHGQILRPLLEKGFEVTVTGSDASCRHRIERDLEHAKAHFVECALTELPFENGSFDAVVSYRMMTHLNEWKRFVEEVCRVSKSRVVLDYPTFRSFNFLNSVLFRWKKGVEGNTRHYHVFHEKEVVNWVEQQGYQLKSRFGQFVLPMALHRAHKNRSLAAALESCFRLTGMSYLFGSPVIAGFEKKGSDEGGR